MFTSKNYERCKIVANRYFEWSLKEGIKNKREAGGSKLIFNGESFMAKHFSSNFLANSENKENLNIFLAKKFVDFHKNASQFGMIRHGINLSKQGYKSILIHTVDSDVLLLSIAYGNKKIGNGIEFINVNLETWLAAKTYDVIQLRDMIGHHRSLALPFFHAFTVYDISSSFYCYGTFIKLSNAPTEIREDQIC